jgi:hypothetical protein
LLNDAYYEFILTGRREIDGLPWVREDRLIPLKAIAWLDLTERKSQGEAIDSKNIRKHLVDILRLTQLLTPETRIALAPQITSDMVRFLDAAGQETSVDPKSLQLGNFTLSELVQRIAVAYEIEF